MNNLLLILLALMGQVDYDSQARSAVVATLEHKAADAVLAEARSYSSSKAAVDAARAEPVVEDKANEAVLEALKEIQSEIAELKRSKEEVVQPPVETPKEVASLENRQPNLKELLVTPKVKQGPLFYSRGRSQWTWPGDLRQHLQNSPHFMTKDLAETLSASTLIRYHDTAHNTGKLRVGGVMLAQTPPLKTTAKAPVVMQFRSNSNCPGGNCPTGRTRSRRR